MIEIDLELIKTIAIVGTAVVAIITFIKGYVEYKNINKLKRIEIYELFSKKMREDKMLMEVIKSLDENEEHLEKISITKRNFFLRFYEDIALALNTKLMRPEIVHYMFGYYAIKCDESKNFWSNDIKKDDPYWSVFIKFVGEMKELEKKINKVNSKFKI